MVVSKKYTQHYFNLVINTLTNLPICYTLNDKYYYFMLKPGWTLRFDQHRNAAGRCFDNNRQLITISIHYLNNTTITKEDVHDTILHEIAHAIVGYQHAHDDVWKQVFVFIGGTGNVFSKPFSKPKFALLCDKGCINYRYLLRKNSSMSCPKHRTTICDIVNIEQ